MAADTDLWSFAQHFYAEPGVAEACLALQDDAGADVCLVLRLLHLAMTRRSVAVAAISEMDAAARPWRESVIVPLRMVRRELRRNTPGYPGAAALRSAVAAIEIEAERLQLAFLDAADVTTHPAATPHAAAQTSFSAYCAVLSKPPDSMARLLALFDAYHSGQAAS
jgi:uncharacterized protein (TIGR02444 family)